MYTLYFSIHLRTFFHYKSDLGLLNKKAVSADEMAITRQMANKVIGVFWKK